jgi:hypothetical protein
MKQSQQSIEAKWHFEAEVLRAQAEKLSDGEERAVLLRKARQLGTAAHMEDWITSSGLQPPT